MYVPARGDLRNGVFLLSFGSSTNAIVPSHDPCNRNLGIKVISRIKEIVV